MRPEDANALKYKKAVEQRVEDVAQLVGSSNVGLTCGTDNLRTAPIGGPEGKHNQSLCCLKDYMRAVQSRIDGQRLMLYSS